MALREQLAAFRDIVGRLQPFESQLAELTLEAQEREGKPSLRAVIKDFDNMRRAVVRTGKEASLRVSKATSVKEAERLAEEVFWTNTQTGHRLHCTKPRLCTNPWLEP